MRRRRSVLHWKCQKSEASAEAFLKWPSCLCLVCNVVLIIQKRVNCIPKCNSIVANNVGTKTCNIYHYQRCEQAINLIVKCARLEDNSFRFKSDRTKRGLLYRVQLREIIAYRKGDFCDLIHIVAIGASMDCEIFCANVRPKVNAVLCLHNLYLCVKFPGNFVQFLNVMTIFCFRI